MNLNRFVTPGNITAAFSVLAVIAGAFGNNALKTFLDDPSTLQTTLTLLGIVGTMAAGHMKGTNQQ